MRRAPPEGSAQFHFTRQMEAGDAAGGRSRRAGGKDNRHAEKKIVEAAGRISKISSW